MTTQTERMMKLETNLENISDKLDTHTKDQRDDFDKILSKLDNLENAFAGKWVEKVTIGILITFIAGLLLTLF